MYFLFSVLFVSWGAYNSFQWGKIDYFTVIMGLGFLVIGVIAYNKNKKPNINC
jgi:cbb3-type cytochrome oxidase subunit 3